MSNFIRENPLVKTNGNSSESPSVTDQSQSRSCVLDKSNDQITVDDIFNLGINQFVSVKKLFIGRVKYFKVIK